MLTFSAFNKWDYFKEDCMRTFNGFILVFIVLVVAFAISIGSAAEYEHPQQITVNGKIYNWPTSPLVVVCIDGGDPEYINAALEKGLLPNIKKFMDAGFSAVAYGAMPSFTNPNNISIITGMPPSVHGISGNYFLNPETGKEVMMNEPEFVRADSILATFSEHGAKVVAITAKDKLSKMLRYKVKNGITFSSEKADKCTKQENGIENCLTYVGKPLPDVYSGDLSTFVLEAGIKILEREKPDITYLSLTDYIQHKYAPGTKEANDFYSALDDAFGRLSSLGATVALTGDHGMNDKSNADGSPKVIYLQDVLDKEIGEGKTKVILPITDPYVVHHGALGSFATVFVNGEVSTATAVNAIRKLRGVELVMDRESAAKTFELPADRIGDLIVIGDKGTVLGTKKNNHDLSKLGGTRLRSHGGLADSKVYFILPRPLKEKYKNIAESYQIRNYDIFDFALNGMQ
jgi:phosphonoacetate hydrolase